MRISFEENKDQLSLIKKMASSNKLEAAEAQEAFAAFIGPVVQEVLQQASTATAIYRDVKFNEDEDPSLPVDLYYGQDEGYITTWSQTIAGGLPTSHVSGMQEIKLATYSLDSAVSMSKKYAKRARLDVVAKAVERMIQEILVKQEKNAWAVVTKGLADAQTKNLKHVIRAASAGNFQLDDLNKLLTLAKRINASFANGTPANFNSKGITDIFVSPEIKEDIRGFVYQPLNTRAGVITNPSADGAASSVVALPDSIRTDIYNAAGTQEIFGVTIHELNELGVGQKYNSLFGLFAGATNYGGSPFVPASQEIIVGVDMGRDALIRPVEVNSESGGTVRVMPDDQWVTRSEKLGWFCTISEGRVLLDSRSLLGIIV